MDSAPQTAGLDDSAVVTPIHPPDGQSAPLTDAPTPRTTDAPFGPAVDATAPPKRERLLSLDAFRGVTIAGMLLVNNPGTWAAIHPPLRHAEWHGWTVTDLIFPFFLFIVGVSMTLSFGARAAAGAAREALMRKALRRAAILFGLGLLLHGFPNYLQLDTLRIPGVLQRIGLAYLAASAIVLYLKPRGQAAAVAALLLGYWALLMLVPFPGGTPGVLEPGLDLGAYIDRLVFGESHLWRSSRTWDPEGLLSTLPAVATVLLGVFSGRWLKSPRDAVSRTIWLLVAGTAAVAVGLAWGELFPINKNLWTSSYVLLSAGLACHFLAICYWLIDVRGHRAWAMPFVMFGVNAIAAFFLSGIFARLLGMIQVQAGPDAASISLKGLIYTRGFVPLFTNPANASLAFALSFVLLWLGIMTVMYRRRIVIKV
jgi:predicted acyltransferase